MAICTGNFFGWPEISEKQNEVSKLPNEHTFFKKHIVGRYGGMTFKKPKVYLPNFSKPAKPAWYGGVEAAGLRPRKPESRGESNPWDFHHSPSSLRIILQYEISRCEGFSSFKITLVVKEHPQRNITPPKFDTQPESHGREDSIRNHCFQVRAVNFGSVPD